jgi:hypothetical protein
MIRRLRMCDCIEKVNKQLETQGYKLSRDILFSVKTGQLDVSGPIVLTEEIKPRYKKVKYIHLYPPYCPFCGMEYAPVPAPVEKPVEAKKP